LIRWIFLFTFVSFNLFALEISLKGAKEDFQTYSILHIKNKDKFLCQEVKNDFDVVTKIICAFSKEPVEKLKPLQNDFFKIDIKFKDKTFFLIITPYKKIKLYPMLFKLYKEDDVFSSNVKLSNHWMIIGYDKTLPYIQKQEDSDIAINFPFYLKKDKLPYVGSLDLKGNPIYIKEVGDVSNYLKIKQYFKEKKYDKCLELIDDVMHEYPNSLFNAELLYYKIIVNSKLKNYDNVIELAKVFLREYSADDNIAEVLALSAKAYYLNGLNSQADYFFDRLFSEHPDSPYTKWGYIYKGEMLEDSGAFSKALKYYKKALNETKSVEIAANAAYHITTYYIENSKKKEASNYVMKIIKAKPEFFAQKYKSSLKMMQDFADAGEYISAAYIAKALLGNINEEYDEYESILKNEGIWLSKTTHKKEALKALNQYLKKFPDGMFVDEVQKAKDGLFFDLDDKNASVMLNEYDKLIQTYGLDSIGQRAIYEKAKLMLKNEMYNDVLSFKEDILSLDSDKYKDIKEIINDAALGAMQVALDKKECKNVLDISSEYAISLSDNWDDGIYECAMKGADFKLAKKVADKNLKSKDLEIRKKWLYRYIKIDFATGNYTDVVKASQDLISLMDTDKNIEYKDIYRILFDTYHRLENYEKMIEVMGKLEQIYKTNYLDIDRYVAMVNVGSQRKDDNLIIKYANKVMRLQKSSDSYAQSPFIEFTLYQAYIDKGNYNEALRVIKSLDKIKLNKAQRARQKYLLGNVYQKLWRDEDAKKAFKESLDADKTSPWAKLAQSAIDE
jgi:tetratricopeptide (TPR) repeat protein